MFRKILLRAAGILVLGGFIYLNIDYWQDPPYWRRWWDLVTNLEPDYMNFSPTAVLASSQPKPLDYAPAAERTVSPAALQAVEDYAAEFNSFSLLVIQGGRVQHEWYAPGWDPERLTQSQSMMKTVTAIMVGMAIADGYIESTSDPLGRYFEEWAGDPRGEITVADLMTMSSGLAQFRFTLNPFAADSSFRFLNTGDRRAAVMRTPLEWAPGSRFDYNDVAAQLAGMLVERASGRPYADYVLARLWQPLGGQHAELWLDRPGGTVMTACCFLAAPRDWAKIGLMLKDGGRIYGQQVVPEDWVERMITPSPQYPGYGYFTWLGAGIGDKANEPGEDTFQTEPFLAEDTVMLLGYGGQRVYFSRALDLVVVRLGPFAGLQPLKSGWDNAYLFNTVIRGLQP